VPHYVSQTPSPKAALALVRAATHLLGASVSTVDLEIASAAYERQVNEVVAADEDMTEYVHRLEQAVADATEHDLPLPDSETLAAEAERFLRDQGS
jgi:predicted ATP-grasp superfamily ATP-dependent carboligase